MHITTHPIISVVHASHHCNISIISIITIYETSQNFEESPTVPGFSPNVSGFSRGFPQVFPISRATKTRKKKQGTQGGDLHSEDGCAQGLHQQGGNLEESGDCEWLWMVMSLLIWWFLYITSGIILWTDMNRLLWMVDNGGIMLMNHGDFSIDDCNTTLSLVSIYQLCLIGIYWYIN